MIVGPVYYKNDGVRRDLIRTIQFPIVFEVGRQWGVSLGVLQRQTLCASCDTNLPPKLTGPAVWQLRWMGLLSRHENTPEFVRRQFVGAQMEIGSETTAFSLGFGDKTTVRPVYNHAYTLCYDSARPDAASFVVDPLPQTLANHFQHTNTN